MEVSHDIVKWFGLEVNLRIMIMTWIVDGSFNSSSPGFATRKISWIPKGWQNVFEYVVGIYSKYNSRKSWKFWLKIYLLFRFIIFVYFILQHVGVNSGFTISYARCKRYTEPSATLGPFSCNISVSGKMV